MPRRIAVRGYAPGRLQVEVEGGGAGRGMSAGHFAPGGQ